MDIKVKEQDLNLFKIDVTLTEEDIKKEIRETLSYYQKNANIPGFRKGKVPIGVIKKSLGGDEELEKDAKKAVIAKAEDKINENYRAITELKLEEESEDGMRRVYSFEATPEIEIPKLDELEVEHKKTKFDKEKIIEETLERYREEYSILNPLDKEIVEEGDIAEVQITKEDGEKFFDRFEVSEKSQSKLAKETLGKKVNEEFDFEDNGEKRKVEVSAILEKLLPELNDEFANQIDPKIKTLDELKKQLEESINSYIKDLEENAINSEIIAKVIEETKIKVSDKTMERLVKSELERIRKEQESKGSSLDKYLEEKKLTEEELKENIKKDILDYWKESLVIQNLSAIFNLKVTTQEIVNTLISMYPYLEKDKRKLENNVKKDPSLYSEIVDLILKHKISSKIRDKVNVKVVEEDENGEDKSEEA